jgi:hypothetical protein
MIGLRCPTDTRIRILPDEHQDDALARRAATEPQIIKLGTMNHLNKGHVASFGGSRRARWAPQGGQNAYPPMQPSGLKY